MGLEPTGDVSRHILNLLPKPIRLISRSLVGILGLEPRRLSTQAFEAWVAANYTTSPMFISCVANQPFVVNHSGCVLGSPFERKKYLVETAGFEPATYCFFWALRRKVQKKADVLSTELCPEQILLKGVRRRLQITYD